MFEFGKIHVLTWINHIHLVTNTDESEQLQIVVYKQNLKKKECKNREKG